MTKDERKYLSRVAELGCAVCRRIGYEGTLRRFITLVVV